nr:hypothetical protein [Prevotella sp.]
MKKIEILKRDVRLLFGLGSYVTKEENDLTAKYYIDSSKPNINHKIHIFMVDGRSVHGGLADRLKGIVSNYLYAKEHKIRFYINFKYPFKLEDYLVPNIYDWTINEKDICYNSKYSRPLLVNTHQLSQKYHRLYLWLHSFGYKQIHIYSNSEYGNPYFSSLFSELFKPSRRLQEDIDKNLAAINGEYISATFRFQQLLGDFKERNYPTLSKEEQGLLIKKCQKQLDLLHNLYPNMCILVTADSGKFLDSVRHLDYVYVIPGEVVHMDYTDNVPFEVYEKSFLDFFLIANANKIHLFYNKQMYHSGFPKLASLLFKHDYYERYFE